MTRKVVYLGSDKKHLEEILKASFCRNFGQINQGLIPMSVHQSWLSAKCDFLTHHIHVGTKPLGTWPGRECCSAPPVSFPPSIRSLRSC